MKKIYIANPTDTRWNEVKFEVVGYIDGKTYVSSEDKISFTKAVTLPNELKPSEEQRLKEIEHLKELFISEADRRMNEAAHARGYDSIITAVSYKDSPTFGKESEAFFKWRDAVYVWGYKLLNDLKEGKVSVEEMKDINKVFEVMPKLELE